MLRGPRGQVQWTGSHPITENVLEWYDAFLLTPIQIRTSYSGMGSSGNGHKADSLTWQGRSRLQVDNSRNRKESGWKEGV